VNAISAKEERLLSDTIKLPRPTTAAAATGDELWPPEVDLILSAMEVASHDDDAAAAARNRRYQRRMPFRVRAALRLFSDAPDTAAWTLYTRDVDRRGLGFITPHRLPLGYGGTVELYAPSGRKMNVPCTLFRCRQSVQGWYEGALSFNREQGGFDVEG
jgi:hypothetical protein